jgi:hypothetical protein
MSKETLNAVISSLLSVRFSKLYSHTLSSLHRKIYVFFDELSTSF